MEGFTIPQEAVLGSQYIPDPTTPFSNWQQFKSAFKQDNPYASHFAYDTNRKEAFERDESWSAARYISEQDVSDEERKRMWSLGWNTNSLAEFEARMMHDRKETFDRQVLATTGFWERLAYSGLAGIADPVMIASMVFAPGLTVGAKVVPSAMKLGGVAAAEMGFQEMLLHRSQGQRTAEESTYAMAGGFVLGGILGGATSRFMQAPKNRDLAKVIAQTLADVDRNGRIQVDLPPNGAWEPTRPLRLDDEAGLDSAAVNDRIEIENANYFPEGGGLARYFGMQYMTDLMQGQLNPIPTIRKITERLVSADGFKPADFDGTSRGVVNPAQAAINRAQNEFTRRMVDFGESSMRKWQEFIEANWTDRMVDRLTESDVMVHRQRIGELFVHWNAKGGGENALADVQLSFGERGDYRWMNDQMEELADVWKQYEFWQIKNGGFKADYAEILFGQRGMTPEQAEKAIADAQGKASKNTGDYEAGQAKRAKERAYVDRIREKDNEIVQKELDEKHVVFQKTLDENAARTLVAKEQMLRRQLKELEEFDSITQVNKTADIKRRRYKNQPVQEYRMQQLIARKAQRDRIVKRHQRELDQLAKSEKKAATKAYKGWDKATEKERVRLQRETDKINRRRETEDVKAEERYLRENMELMGRAQNLEEGLKNWRLLEEGDYQFAKSLVERFNGEGFYRPQMWNRQRIKERGVEVFAEKALAARLSLVSKMLARESTTPAERLALEMEYDQLSKGLEDPSNMKRFSDMYEHLLDESVLNNNFQSVSTLRETRKESNRMKKREYQVDQSMMLEFLENDMEFLLANHVRTVIPELILKQHGLWDKADVDLLLNNARREMNAMIDRVANDDSLSQRKKSKQVKRLERDFDRGERAVINMMRTLRNDDYADNAQWQKDIVFHINALNGMRTLGGVLPSSISDVPMAMSKVGGEYMVKSMTTLKSDFDRVIGGISKEEMSKLYGLFEYGQANMITKITESDEFGISQSFLSRMMGRAQNGFYKSTLILRWNQEMKQNAAMAMSDRVIEHALGKPTLTEIDLAYLQRDGWTPDRLDRIRDVFNAKGKDGLPYGYEIPGPDGKVDGTGLKVIRHDAIRRDIMDSETLTKADRDLLDQLYRISEDFSSSMNNVADRAIVTPGAGDLPDMAKGHVYMKLLFSLKSFALASLNRTTLPMMGAMKHGDGGTAAWAIAASGMGTMSYLIRQSIYDREITENPQTLFWEGFNRSGMLGIYNQGLTVAQTLTGNFFGLGDAIGFEVPSRYFARGAMTDILGPSFGLGEAAFGVANVYSKALKGDDVSDAEYAKAYRLMPFNNLFYLRAALERMGSNE